MSRSYRSAFTLIELLVVIAIIAILLGLLVPAVQKVREASQRTQCQNNLHNLALALHAYHNDNSRFPSAYVATSTNPGWGWGSFILPYIEQKNMFDSLGVGTGSVFGGGTNPAPATTLTAYPLPIFRCPADGASDVNPLRLNHATANYRAVAGPTTYPSFIENNDFGGIMYQNSRVKIAHITDGTSNTLILGECILEVTTGKRAAIWPGMTGLRDGKMWVSDVMWWIDDAGTTFEGGTNNINGTSPQAFSSRHLGGAYFAFGDGSVRMIIDSADMTTLKFLAGRNDGRPVSLPD